MESRYLKEFIVLCEEKNYWNAAERLYMNQSTLSKHIKAMEKELGIPLFLRTTRNVRLSVFGEVYLEYARKAIREEYSIQAHLNFMKNQEEGALTIGSIPVMPQYGITDLLIHFEEQHPEIRINIVEDDSSILTDMLFHDKCSMAFIRESRMDFERKFLNDSSFVRIPYCSDALVVCLPKDHPLAASEKLTIRDLEGEKFCFLKEGTLIYNLCIDAFQEAGLAPDIAFTSHNVGSLLNMVFNGGLLTILADKHVARPAEAGFADTPPFAVVPLFPSIRTQVSLIYSKDKTLSPSIKKFSDYCSRHLIPES